LKCHKILTDGPAPGKGSVGTHGGPRHWTNQYAFPLGLDITANAVKQIHADLRMNFDMRYTMTSKLDTNPLESTNGRIRRMDGDNVDPNGK